MCCWCIRGVFAFNDRLPLACDGPGTEHGFVVRAHSIVYITFFQVRQSCRVARLS